jgi:hypothetical protein
MGKSDDDSTLERKAPLWSRQQTTRGPAHSSRVVSMQGSPAVASQALACRNVALVPILPSLRFRSSGSCGDRLGEYASSFIDARWPAPSHEHFVDNVLISRPERVLHLHMLVSTTSMPPGAFQIACPCVLKCSSFVCWSRAVRFVSRGCH